MATGGSNGVAKLPTQTPAGPHPVRLLDLFAGAGGLSVGFHRSGGDRIRVVGAVEADRAAAATFSANFPDVPVYRGLIEDWLREETVPSAEIVVGGPPCQGFSTLGKRDEDDERNGLWESYADAVSRARPLYFVLENVPQFARSDQFSLLRKQMRRGGLLEDYSFDTQILNAAHYGSAQLRKRVVVIGHRKDVPMPGFPQPTTPGESIDVLVTERGIAVNPRRPELRQRLAEAGLPVKDIAQLKELAEAIAGAPAAVQTGEKIVAVVEYRDGTGIIKQYRGQRDGKVYLYQYNPEREFPIEGAQVKAVHAVLFRR